MECDELIQGIKSAFADAPAPSEQSIICHECEECFALRDAVRGHTPDELSDSWVEQSFDQLVFFSDDAKRYYLPAFLRVAAHKPDSLVTQFALYTLADDFRLQPSGGYSPQQRQAIRDFLGYIETRVDEYGQKYVTEAKALWQAVA
jgi:hypothetical protein